MSVPQGTYAIGRRAPLQNNFIYTKTQTTKIFVIQTTHTYMKFKLHGHSSPDHKDPEFPPWLDLEAPLE